MLPRPLVAVFFAAWSVSPIWAQAALPAAPSDPSAWAQGFGAAPLIWAILAVSGILTAALIAHLGYSLSERRGAPPELNEAVEHAMEAGNYQEAWEACGHWPAAYLSRVLRPALERIGQGRERVEAALARRRTKESRTLTALTWGLPIGGGVLPLLVLLVSWAGLRALFRSDGAATNSRALTLAEGNFWLIAAAAFAISTTALIFWIILRRRGRGMLSSADAEAARLVGDLAYEDLEGLRVGQEFNAGTMLGEDAENRTSGLLRVSRALTTSCPQCNAPINFSRKTCPNCGIAFEWS